MSDLRGDGRANNAISSARPNIPNPGTSGSPRIKGPQDIMRERNAREARKKQERDEKEAMERRNAEEEARQIELERRRSVERRAAAAGASQEQGGAGQQRTSGGTTGGPWISGNSQRTDRRSGDRINSGAGNQAMDGTGRGSRQQTQPAPIDPGPSGTTGSAPMAAAVPTRSSFPHAFERWETLSAHWEGLTSFWIRRLEENSTEISRDPLSQQLSRQVTDLSAAGANLFHAVVELQRLRASSERKFQRWFFETRAEQERASEVQAMIQANADRERLEHEAEIAKLKARYEQRETENKRELQISKEEAKRAWEELGRREQDERERTTSLREGLPTSLGGVQVVPMLPGVQSRGGSMGGGAREIPPARDGPTATGGPSTLADPFVEPERQAEATRSPPRSAYTAPTSLAGHPAFTNSHSYSNNAMAPAVQPTMSEHVYQQLANTTLQGPSEGTENTYGEEEEYEIDDQGHFILDGRGNKIRYQGPISDDDTDEYDVAEAREREQANLQRYPPISGVEYGHGPTTNSDAARTSGPTSAPSTGPSDYSGQAYGSTAPEWAAVPRHSHPTRLSDVLEEDERSRTSASQLSRH